MEHRISEFSSKNGEPIFYQAWLPPAPPRAVLLVVHGLAEHSGRYEGFAEFFTASGFAVYALDHPGHGKSGGRRAYVRKFSDFTDALSLFVDQIREQQPDAAIVLVGHSMGGLIAAEFLIERQADFSMAVLSGPAIKAHEEPPKFALFIMRVLARLMPRLGVIQLDASGVSRDPEVVRKYVNDPLVYTGKVSARLAVEMFKAMSRVVEGASSIRLPVLLLHGGADTLTAVSGSQLLHDAIGSDDKQIVVYGGLYHEIFNEPERLDVMSEMRAWIDTRLPGSAVSGE